MKFEQLAADELHIVYTNSNGSIVETTFDVATLTGVPFDSNGEPLQYEGYKLSETADMIGKDAPTQIVMLHPETGEEVRYGLKDYMEDGFYFDPDAMVGIIA